MVSRFAGVKQGGKMVCLGGREGGEGEARGPWGTDQVLLKIRVISWNVQFQKICKQANFWVSSTNTATTRASQQEDL